MSTGAWSLSVLVTSMPILLVASFVRARITQDARERVFVVVGDRAMFADLERRYRLRVIETWCGPRGDPCLVTVPRSMTRPLRNDESVEALVLVDD